MGRSIPTKLPPFELSQAGITVRRLAEISTLDYTDIRGTELAHDRPAHACRLLRLVHKYLRLCPNCLHHAYLSPLLARLLNK